MSFSPKVRIALIRTIFTIRKFLSSLAQKLLCRLYVGRWPVANEWYYPRLSLTPTLFFLFSLNVFISSNSLKSVSARPSLVSYPRTDLLILKKNGSVLMNKLFKMPSGQKVILVTRFIIYILKRFYD